MHTRGMDESQTLSSWSTALNQFPKAEQPCKYIIEKGSHLKLLATPFSNEIQILSKTPCLRNFSFLRSDVPWSPPVGPVPAMSSLKNFPIHMNSEGLWVQSNCASDFNGKIVTKSLLEDFQMLRGEVRECAAVWMFTAQGKALKPDLFHKGAPECELSWGGEIFLLYPAL